MSGDSADEAKRPLFNVPHMSGSVEAHVSSDADE